MPKGRRAAGRRATRRAEPPADRIPADPPADSRAETAGGPVETARPAPPRAAATMPSAAEIAVYLSTGTVVAAGVIIAAGQPWWHAAAVAGMALAMVVVLMIVERRTGSESERSAGPETEPPTARGRRRKR